MQVTCHDSLRPRSLEAVRASLREALRDQACLELDPRWLDVLRAGLGHRTMLLTAERDGQIVGLLPLANVSSRLFGRFLVSLPYVNRAGIAAADQQAQAALWDRAVELAGKQNVKYLELRQVDPIGDQPALTDQRDDKVLMWLDLPDDVETLWTNLSSKVRNQIRKGDKHELSIRFGRHELLDGFHRVFSENMRDLGTPVYPRKLFAAMLDGLGDDAQIALVTCDDHPCAVAILTHDNLSPVATMQVPSASTLRRFNHTNANMWMYHHLLCRAIEQGSKRFDFGRSSPDAGTFRFKKQWGALPQRTVWQYHLRQGDLGAMRPDDPKMKRRIETWQKLPLWVTRLAGPRIVRGIP